MQRGKDAAEGVQARRVVAQRWPKNLRPRGIEIEVKDARQGNADRVVGGAVDIGTPIAKTGNGAMDEPGIRAREDVSVKPEPIHDARPKILDQDVGCGHKFEEACAAAALGEVDLNAGLVLIVGNEVRAVIAARGLAERIAADGMFHLGDIRAQLPKHHRGQGRRDHGTEVQHLETVQRKALRRHGLAASCFAGVCRA